MTVGGKLTLLEILCQRIRRILYSYALKVFTVGWKFPSTNQKYFTDLVVTRQQYGIFALLPQTLFRRKTSGGVDKCRVILWKLPTLLFVTSRET